MSIFVYTENVNGVYKKITFESVSYAKSIAGRLGTTVTAISVNPADDSEVLYRYGADKVIKIMDEGLKSFNAKAYAEAIAPLAVENIIVFPQTNSSSSIAAILSVIKGFSLITGALEEPKNIFPFEVKKKVFSGKGFMFVRANADGVIVTLSPNSFGIRENCVEGREEVVECSTCHHHKVISHEQSTNTIDLKEAEIVVSGGRGIKEVEHWKLVEELAKALGGVVACSKPVSDNAIRPHSEHVGQTGKVISPNLYIAVGISGAIQHLAGVNSSKTIVVINNDPEAPFFKSADYGIVGDAVQILPILTDKIRIFKG